MTSPLPYALSEDEFDALRSITHRFSLLTLLAAGQSSNTVEMSTAELHEAFCEPWLRLRDLVEGVEARTASRSR